MKGGSIVSVAFVGTDSSILQIDGTTIESRCSELNSVFRCNSAVINLAKVRLDKAVTNFMLSSLR